MRGEGVLLGCELWRPRGPHRVTCPSSDGLQPDLGGSVQIPFMMTRVKGLVPVAAAAGPSPGGLCQTGSSARAVIGGLPPAGGTVGS